jgi:nucleoside-diphosphate-sugar epimerase
VADRVLVIGGTGPTGVNIVAGLVERGWDVTIMHRGLHERAETPGGVPHLHADPFDAAAVAEVAAGRSFDLVMGMYGRLRRIAEAFEGRCGRFMSVGGVPAHRGWMNPWAYDPPGLPVPIPEDGPVVDDPADDEKGFRVARTEDAVFRHHPTATHFRYPYMYGPYQPVPREWSIVRRVLDGRGRMIVADGGLTLHHHGYTANVAHGVLLAVDRAEAAAGRVYNVGDDEVLSTAQVIALAAAALGAEIELVSMPHELAVAARPLMAQPLPTHRVLDLTRIRSDLGYRDLVPAREAIGLTARWLADNPLGPDAPEARVLGDPFDYCAEDALMDAWARVLATLPEVAFHPAPGYGSAYSGPGGRPRTHATFKP